MRKRDKGVIGLSAPSSGCLSPLATLSPFHNHLLTSGSSQRCTRWFFLLTMSWRNQGITGSNNIPLGNRRRFGESDDGGYNPAEPSTGLTELKRGRSPTRELSIISQQLFSLN